MDWWNFASAQRHGMGGVLKCAKVLAACMLIGVHQSSESKRSRPDELGLGSAKGCARQGCRALPLASTMTEWD